MSTHSTKRKKHPSRQQYSQLHTIKLFYKHLFFQQTLSLDLHIFLFCLLPRHELTSTTYLKATYDSNDVVGTMAVLLRQDQRLRSSLIIQTVEDVPLGQGVKPCDKWAMTKVLQPTHPVWLTAHLRSNPTCSSASLLHWAPLASYP